MNVSSTITTVGDIMTKKAVTLGPDDTLATAAGLFEKYNYDGFPIVDGEGHLVGLLTAYDMVLQSAKVHLPAIFSFLRNSGGGTIDDAQLQSHFAKLQEIRISEIMNIDPLVVQADGKVDDLAKEFVEHHRVNPIPVVSHDKKLMGIVSRYDVIRFFNQQYLTEVLQSADHTGILQRLTRLDEKQDG